MLIAANAHLGRMDEARRMVDRLRSNSPGVTVNSIRVGQVDLYADRMAAVLSGLRLAGLEEG